MKKLTNIRLDGRIRTLVFEGDRIARIEEGALPPEPGDLDGAGLLAVPGLVDIHSHGCLGLDTMDADFAEMAAFRAKHGTTTWLPTTMTAFREDLERVCAAPRDVPGARLPGIHLEGPHIALSRKGAQNPACIRPPDLDELRVLRPAAIRVTIAPELPGALDYVRGAAAMGVSVTLGHTDATYEQACAGFDAGASSLTHTFNAMPGIHHRKPGPIGAALEKGAYAEMICDGLHVHPSAVRMAFRLFPGRICLISDSLRCCGMPDGRYTLGGQEVFLKGRIPRLADGTIAGSATNLYDCMLLAIAFGIPREEALAAATILPARQIGAEEELGSIEAGKRADFVICDGSLRRKAVYIGGVRV